MYNINKESYFKKWKPNFFYELSFFYVPHILLIILKLTQYFLYRCKELSYIIIIQNCFQGWSKYLVIKKIDLNFSNSSSEYK